MVHTLTLHRYNVDGLNGRKLGRNLHHDERSRRFQVRPTGDIRPVLHTRQCGIFDQGNLGSCVPNAGVGCLAYEPFFTSVRDRIVFEEQTCVDYYRKVTAADPFPGQYPPDDTGSDGLSMASVLKGDGLISGYTHAFDPETARAALSDSPFIIGIPWYSSMFDPDPDGMVGITSNAYIVGGHEVIIDQNVDNEVLGSANSWGSNWGVNGRFFMTNATFAKLLSQDGDATFFVPLTQPSPPPVDPPVEPTTDAEQLARGLRPWLTSRDARSGASKARHIVRDYLKKSGV